MKMKFFKERMILIKAIAIAIIVAFISSCNKDSQNNLLDQSERSEQDEIMYRYLVDELKLNPNELEEDENAFYYQECIEYNKTTYFGTDGISSRWNQKLGTTIDAMGVNGSVRVNYNNNLPSEWIDAFDDAIPEWNNRLGHIKFIKNAGGTFGTITISYETLYNSLGNKATNVFARASAPTAGGNVGPTIRVNDSYTGTALNVQHKLKTAVHEIGHCIGLGHTDSNDAEFLYTGNSTCDNNTEGNGFMRQGRIEYSGFSTCDQEAYEALYERVYIMASNSKYLCSENGNIPAIADRTQLLPWEKFKIKKNSDGSYAILGNNNKWGDVDRGGGHTLVFNGPDRYNPDCKFYIDKVEEPDIYTIKFKRNGETRYLNSKGGTSKVTFIKKSGYGQNDKWRIFKLVDCNSGVCPTTFK